MITSPTAANVNGSVIFIAMSWLQSRAGARCAMPAPPGGPCAITAATASDTAAVATATGSGRTERRWMRGDVMNPPSTRMLVSRPREAQQKSQAGVCSLSEQGADQVRNAEAAENAENLSGRTER